MRKTLVQGHLDAIHANQAQPGLAAFTPIDLGALENCETDQSWQQLKRLERELLMARAIFKESSLFAQKSIASSTSNGDVY